MKNIRFIAKLDIKGEHMVKGIQLEGLRKLGNPNDFARKYYRGNLSSIVKETAKIFLYRLLSAEEFAVWQIWLRDWTVVQTKWLSIK